MISASRTKRASAWWLRSNNSLTATRIAGPIGRFARREGRLVREAIAMDDVIGGGPLAHAAQGNRGAPGKPRQSALKQPGTCYWNPHT